MILSEPNKWLVVACGFGLLVGISSAHAQKPAFEVASIKPNKSSSLATRMNILPGGRFEATNYTVSQLIRWAYTLERSELDGGPAWIAQDRFDVVAKAADGIAQTNTSMRSMVQALLADRFKLVAHKESRDQPVYVLTLARSDGKLGPQLTRSDVDCSESAALTASSPNVPRCGLVMRPREGLTGLVTIREFAAALVGLVQRKVLDRTDLEGTYALNMSFTPDPGAVGAASADQNAGSIFTALREQLGLKLEGQRAPIDVLVIDSVEHPTED